MVDYLRPSLDVSTGGWTPSVGTTLWETLDELTQVDADYVKSSSNPSNDTFEVALTDPSSALLDGTLKFAIGKESNNAVTIDVVVALVQGTAPGTVIASWSYPDVAFGLTLKTETLTAPQIAAVTNFNDLRLRVTANAPVTVAVLSLDFTAMTDALDSRITFARATGAYSFNSDGLFVHAPVNALYPSNNFADARWTKENTTITTGVADPLGGSTASTLTAVGGSSHLDRRLYTPGPGAGAFGLLSSIWIRRRTGTGTVYLTDSSGSNYVPVTVTSTWSRVSTPESPGVWFMVALGTNGDAVDIWRAQMDFRSPSTMALPRTYVESTTALAMGPRFDHDPVTLVPRGLLIEEQRTNDLLQGRNLGDAAWAKTNITVTLATGADGNTLAASVLTAAGANGTCLQALTAASATRSQSALVKRITGTGVVEMTMDNGATWTPITVTSSWTRVTIPTQTLSNPIVGFRLVTSGDAIAVDFVQNEIGAFPTSSIPTASVPVTRFADVAVITGTNFSSWWNASAGTFIAQFDGPASGTRPIISADDNTANEVIMLYGSGTDPKANVTDGGTPQTVPDLDAGTIAAGTSYKLAIAFAANDFAACLGGGTVATDTSGTLPTPTQLRIGLGPAGDYLGGHIKSIAFYNMRLPNAQLQSLTA